MTLREMASNFASAISEWIANGAPVVSKAQYKERASQCLECEFWDPEAFAGKGKCLRCGCSGVKLYLATSKCPEGKWEAVKAPLPDSTINQLKRLRKKH